MKIIITEKQYNKLTEDKLQKLCYTVWNQQKKRGEEPHIDDIIYDITDIRKTQMKTFKSLDPFGIDTTVDLITYLKNLKMKLTKKYLI